MNIVWISWKAIDHPQAGGAETVSNEIRKRLVRDGHTVSLITARPSGAMEYESVDGVNVYHVGGRFSVYYKAYKMFKHKFINDADIVVDEMNTIPFFAALYTRKSTDTYLLTYQLARSVWFHQMIFPLSLLGYLLEPLYLRFISKKYKHILTESNSTKVDLQNYGFSASSISTFRVGMELKPLDAFSHDAGSHTILFLGAFREMKRTLDAVKAFELAADHDSKLKLVLAGDHSGKYGSRVLDYIRNSRHAVAIEAMGRVSAEEKQRCLQQAALILVTSVKEGWGLIITEANSQGTPAVAYNVDGLRDSVKDGETGVLVADSSLTAMSDAIIALVENPSELQRLANNAWVWSHEFTFNTSYEDFKAIIRLT